MATKHASKSTKRGAAKKRTSKKIRTSSSPASRANGKTLKKSTAKKSDSNHVGTYKVKREGGPSKWYLPIMESAYSRLRPIGEPEPHLAMRTGTKAFKSNLQPQKGEEVLTSVRQDQWLDILSQYKQRK